ncbi:MAG: hypothetical protein ACXW2E_10145, partial [Nitrososphaeraceae archaeon]
LMIKYEDKNSIEYNDKELYYQNAKNIRINKNHGKNDANIKHKGNDEEFKFETNKFEIINLYIQYYTWNVLINFNKHDILYNYLNNIFDYDLYKFQLNYTDYFDIKNVNPNIKNDDIINVYPRIYGGAKKHKRLSKAKIIKKLKKQAKKRKYAKEKEKIDEDNKKIIKAKYPLTKRRRKRIKKR